MFIRTERSVKEYMRRYPIVSTFVIIYIGIWLTTILQLSIGDRIYDFGIGLNYLIFNGEWWRLLTATFLHADIGHTFFNSFSLVLFGPALERLCGKGRFLLLYLGAGMIGNIGSLFFLHPLQPHLGASGCIYGLFGAYLFLIYKRPQFIDAQSRQMILTIFGIGVIMTFLQPNINISAHLVGALGGFLLAPLLIPQKQARPQAEVIDRDGQSATFTGRTVQFDQERPVNRRPKGMNSKSNKREPNVIFIVIIALALLALLAQIKGH